MDQQRPLRLRIQHRVVRRATPPRPPPQAVTYTGYADMWDGALTLQPCERVMVFAPDTDGPFRVTRLDDTGAVATLTLATASGRPCVLVWMRQDAGLRLCRRGDAEANRSGAQADAVVITASAGRAVDVWHVVCE